MQMDPTKSKFLGNIEKLCNNQLSIFCICVSLCRYIELKTNLRSHLFYWIPLYQSQGLCKSHKLLVINRSPLLLLPVLHTKRTLGALEIGVGLVDPSLSF